MLKRLANFLTQSWDGRSPLLLGYSGGPDSKALLYALLELGCRTVHVAHVDHGWRPESANEARLLQQEAESLSIPFHSIRLTPPSTGNKEAAARKERLAFFSSLAKQFPFQALLLAHHAGDVAETSLKRVLEGAHLSYIGGMQSVTQFSDLGGLTIWRPLLAVKRSEILAFLKEKGLCPLHDPTNSDPVYLRARMRSEILPDLTDRFGKEVSENLSLLSQRSFELRDYLDRKIANCKASRGPWGVFCSLSDLERIEARHLLQNQVKEAGLVSDRTQLEAILDAALSKRPDCNFSNSIFVDRGNVFFLAPTPPQPGNEPLPIAAGTHRWGDWSIAIIETEEQLPPPDWLAVWTGRFSATGFAGSLALPPPGSGLRHIWNERKVPSFLRRQVPVLWKGGSAVKEFLSGKDGKALLEMSPLFKLSFSIP